jgi:single-strand DNA-binding protein
MFCKLCRLGNDPEVRFLTNGTAVMSLSLAYPYGMKGQDGKRPTQWIEATWWGKQAEAIQPFLKKGDQISVSLDDVHIETYTNKQDGTERFKLAGKVVGFDFVANGRTDRPAPANTQKPAGTTSKQSSGNAFDDFEEIPF